MENQYVKRINYTIDYIRANVEKDLSLNAIAKLVHFSPFHFHRIFKTLTNETLNQFVSRTRLERAATLMKTDYELHALDAALAVGYESAEGFSRAFKKHFGVSPGKWDRNLPLEDRKISQVFAELPAYTAEELEAQAEFKVELMERLEQRIAYVRVDNSYSDFDRIKAAYHQLIEWYQSIGGNPEEETLYGMSQDDPDITRLEDCRFDWCLSIPSGVQVTGDISVRRLPAHQSAAICINGDIALEDRAIQYLWRYWLPRSQYQPANLPGMEIYNELPHLKNWQTFNMWCAIPVERF